MKLKKFSSFINENLEEKNKNERKFLKRMEDMSKSFLSEEETDVEHPIYDVLGSIILRVYDRYYLKKDNSEGLSEEDYKIASLRIKELINKWKKTKNGELKIKGYKSRLSGEAFRRKK